MKILLKQNPVIIPLISIILMVSFTQCHPTYILVTNQGNIKSYIKVLQDSNAIALSKKNHIVTVDLMQDYVNRFSNYRQSLNAGQETLKDVFDSTCSFNIASLVRVLSDSNCIGLRVLYGMNNNRKFRILLAGIKPDYSTLYLNLDNNDSVTAGGAAQGVLEMAQHP